MTEVVGRWFLDLGFSEVHARVTAILSLSILLILSSYLINLIVRLVLKNIVSRIVQRTATRWDDIILEQGVLSRATRIVPALIIYLFIPPVFSSMAALGSVLQRFVLAWITAVCILVINSLLSAVNVIYKTYEISKSRPIKGYLQVLKIFVVIIGVVLILTTIADRSPLGILSGIGAMSAIILLVFKDAIMGLVASIQLTGNDMIRIGDWITVPAYGADGDVLDITLQTVTVQNFDKTIVSVPIYSLVSNSFRNWRGMSESGGRRIKRSLNLDMNSIKFCTREMVDRFRRIDVLGDYIDSKLKEIDEENRSRKANTSEMINGRRMTNIGIFRAYISAYLREHPKIHNDMTFLVRQLQPTDKGLPLEIYVFSNDQVWANYEGLQADIFDHLLASISFFELAVYQSPSSMDVRMLKG